MTRSAGEWTGDSDWLDRALELYRDLSVVLADRIAALKAGLGQKPGCAEAMRSLEAHRRALQTVIDNEAKIGRRSREWAGAAGELDLDAARAEIVARLSVWAAAR